mmetsp:Transcript_1378/g.2959  ORF Transcript_1378/g.2959 Transcript_1378/m.2959 type:complete len:325 (+) Transcript_1378:1020-1994(+)
MQFSVIEGKLSAAGSSHHHHAVVAVVISLQAHGRGIGAGGYEQWFFFFLGSSSVVGFVCISFHEFRFSRVHVHIYIHATFASDIGHADVVRKIVLLFQRDIVILVISRAVVLLPRGRRVSRMLPPQRRRIFQKFVFRPLVPFHPPRFSGDASRGPRSVKFSRPVATAAFVLLLLLSLLPRPGHQRLPRLAPGTQVELGPRVHLQRVLNAEQREFGGVIRRGEGGHGGRGGGRSGGCGRGGGGRGRFRRRRRPRGTRRGRRGGRVGEGGASRRFSDFGVRSGGDGRGAAAASSSVGDEAFAQTSAAQRGGPRYYCLLLLLLDWMS